MDADGGHKRTLLTNWRVELGALPAAGRQADDLRVQRARSDPKSRNFDLYLIDLDGTGLERITFDDDFDGFPMFSPDGKKLVWAANRHGSQPHETNLFLADWLE